MRIVVVSSPGAGTSVHWSHAAALELARVLLLGGARVEWLAAATPGHELPLALPGVVAGAVSTCATTPVHRVTAGMTDLELEVALSRSLRSRPAHAVVHFGTGARGSPNVLWLADRLGSAVFAVVRAAEVVCQRGDLVDFAGEPCPVFDDPERCRRCCGPSRWSRPRTVEFRNRIDLLAGGLLVTKAVFVPDPADVQPLVTAGVPRHLLVPTHTASAIADRVLARAPVQ
ncbi:MAG TPA: hypothetical protein VFZ65_06870 [Planctomycetota bacterium]|nr:hypothetical protein [Planctomycetota bacterium]